MSSGSSAQAPNLRTAIPATSSSPRPAPSQPGTGGTSNAAPPPGRTTGGFKPDSLTDLADHPTPAPEPVPWSLTWDRARPACGTMLARQAADLPSWAYNSRPMTRSPERWWTWAATQLADDPPKDVCGFEVLAELVAAAERCRAKTCDCSLRRWHEIVQRRIDRRLATHGEHVWHIEVDGTSAAPHDGWLTVSAVHVRALQALTADDAAIDDHIDAFAARFDGEALSMEIENAAGRIFTVAARPLPHGAGRAWRLTGGRLDTGVLLSHPDLLLEVACSLTEQATSDTAQGGPAPRRSAILETFKQIWQATHAAGFSGVAPSVLETAAGLAPTWDGPPASLLDAANELSMPQGPPAAQSAGAAG